VRCSATRCRTSAWRRPTPARCRRAWSFRVGRPKQEQPRNGVEPSEIEVERQCDGCGAQDDEDRTHQSGVIARVPETAGYRYPPRSRLADRPRAATTISQMPTTAADAHHHRRERAAAALPTVIVWNSTSTQRTGRFTVTGQEANASTRRVPVRGGRMLPFEAECERGDGPGQRPAVRIPLAIN
jgi:hypothetical protein